MAAWFERASFSWALEPGDMISECSHCPRWHAAVEADDLSPTGLSLREWHDDECPILSSWLRAERIGTGWRLVVEQPPEIEASEHDSWAVARKELLRRVCDDLIHDEMATGSRDHDEYSRRWNEVRSAAPDQPFQLVIRDRTYRLAPLPS